MKRTSQRLVRSIVAVGFATIAGAAGAQAFPTKPVRVFLPLAPGGVGDITARLVAQKMSDSMGQQVLIENRPGAGGVLSAGAAARAEPDGYTLALTGNGTAISATLFKSLPYNALTDFAHVSTIGFFDIALVVPAESRFHSVADVVAYGKANPGKLSVGTINIGSTQHLAAEVFRSMAGIDAQTVPYKASAAVVNALRANDVQVVFEILAPVLPQLRSKTLRALAVSSSRRFPGLPDVPTVAESGLPGFELASWNGISAPARTPPAIVERLNREIVAAVAAPDVRQKMLDIGVDARSSTPAEMRSLMVADIAKWKAVIERAGIERQ
jgi:tripartite-type tricarboxylate transporter receptor subunit TctC